MKPVVVQGLCNNKNFATYFFDMITVLGFSCLDTMCQNDSEFLLFSYLGFFYFTTVVMYSVYFTSAMVLFL